MSALARRARPADGAALRGLLRSLSVGEAPALYFEREPAFFAGPPAQTLSVLAAGRLRGMLSRSLRPAFVNGKAAEAGALRNLRVSPGPEALEVLAAGSAGLRRLHRDGRARYYLAALPGTASRIAGLLARGRLGLPRPLFRDKLVTLSFATGGKAGTAARPRPWPAMRNFLEARLKDFQFAPRFPSRPRGGSDWVAWEGPAGLGGLAAIKDERAYRQIRVARLPAAWKFLRLPCNALLPRLRRWPALPAEGERLESASLCAFAAADLDAARRLLEASLSRASLLGIKALNISLSEGHPWLRGLQRLGGLAVESRLALLHWGDGEAALKRLDSRPAQIDVSDL
jgi:hypothetical protein